MFRLTGTRRRSLGLYRQESPNGSDARRAPGLASHRRLTWERYVAATVDPAIRRGPQIASHRSLARTATVRSDALSNRTSRSGRSRIHAFSPRSRVSFDVTTAMSGSPSAVGPMPLASAEQYCSPSHRLNQIDLRGHGLGVRLGQNPDRLRANPEIELRPSGSKPPETRRPAREGGWKPGASRNRSDG